MATGNADFNGILSTTFKKVAPTIEDNIFTNSPLLYFLMEAGHIDTVTGGYSLVTPLMYGSNSTAGSYLGYDNILTTPQDGITAAEYPWRQYAGTIAISGLEEIQNDGPEQISSLLDAKTEQLKMTIEENWEDMFFADGTGNGGKDWLGLMHFVPDNAATLTVGNIDSTQAANSWWRPTSTNAAGVLTIAAMSRLYNTISRGKMHPDFGLATQNEYEAYEALLQPALRYTDSSTADAGFENLLYKRMPLMFSSSAPSGSLFMLNSRFLRLKKSSREWFTTTDFEKPHGQNARYAQILCAGNLVCNNRRHLGKLFGLTD